MAPRGAGQDEAPDLFVTSGDGWYFDEPDKITRADGHILFDVPIAERPAGVEGPPEAVDLLFTSGSQGLTATYVPVAPTG